MDSTILDGNTTNQIGTKTGSSGTNTLMVLTLDLTLPLTKGAITFLFQKSLLSRSPTKVLPNHDHRC